VDFNIDVRFIPREMARLFFLSEEYAVRAQAAQMAREVIQSAEFLSKNPTTAVYVTRFYRAFLGRFPNDAEVAYWSAELDSGRQTTDGVIGLFADSAEFTGRLGGYFDGP